MISVLKQIFIEYFHFFVVFLKKTEKNLLQIKHFTDWDSDYNGHQGLRRLLKWLNRGELSLKLLHVICFENSDIL